MPTNTPNALDDTDVDGLFKLLQRDSLLRTAATENYLRRQMSVQFDAAREKHGLSIPRLAEITATPVPQIERLLHRQVGGLLTLQSLVRAADALGLILEITVREPDLDL